MSFNCMHMKWSRMSCLSSKTQWLIRNDQYLVVTYHLWFCMHQPIQWYFTHVGYSCHPSPTSVPTGTVQPPQIISIQNSLILTSTTPDNQAITGHFSHPLVTWLVTPPMDWANPFWLAWCPTACIHWHAVCSSPRQNLHTSHQQCSSPSQWHWNMCLDNLG